MPKNKINVGKPINGNFRKKENKQQCLSCGKVVDLAKKSYWSAPSIEIGSGESFFCCETCIVNYFNLRWVDNKTPKH